MEDYYGLGEMVNALIEMEEEGRRVEREKELAIEIYVERIVEAIRENSDLSPQRPDPSPYYPNPPGPGPLGPPRPHFPGPGPFPGPFPDPDYFN